jgi:hypothetical protein
MVAWGNSLIVFGGNLLTADRLANDLHIFNIGKTIYNKNLGSAIFRSL